MLARPHDSFIQLPLLMPAPSHFPPRESPEKAIRYTGDFWTRLHCGVTASGALYPVVLFAIGLPLLLVLATIEFYFSLPELIWFLYAVAYMPVGVFLSFFYVGLISAFVLLSLRGILKMSGSRPPLARLGLFAGAFVAMCAFSPVSLALNDLFGFSGFEFAPAVTYLFAYVVAVFCGQVGGLSCVAYDLRKPTKQLNSTRQFRFSTRYLFAITTLLSVALCVHLALGSYSAAVAIHFFVGICLHFLLGCCSVWITNRLLDRKLRLRRETRLAARST